jgi:hypothetical protein
MCLRTSVPGHPLRSGFGYAARANSCRVRCIRLNSSSDSGASPTSALCPKRVAYGVQDPFHSLIDAVSLQAEFLGDLLPC